MKAEKAMLTVLGQMTAKAEAEGKKESAAMHTTQNNATRRRRAKVWLIQERCRFEIEKRKRDGPPGYMESLTERTQDTLAYIRSRRRAML